MAAVLILCKRISPANDAIDNTRSIDPQVCFAA